jgi:pyruvate kinase
MPAKKQSKAQIVATLGPACTKLETLEAMARHHMNVARLNLAWGTFPEHAEQVRLLRKVEERTGCKILILVDLPGPRVQESAGHTYNRQIISSLTEYDRACIAFGVEYNVDYFGLSFVSRVEDIAKARQIINDNHGQQKVIAKIERKVAMDNLDPLIAAADAVMVARGDLGNELPLEQIPFAEATIIHKAKHAGKPVITATQMLLSMTDNPLPTRAEVTDVAHAILLGTDAVMLSEETSKGKYPVEAVTMMEKIVLEAEHHMGSREHINPL